MQPALQLPSLLEMQRQPTHPKSVAVITLPIVNTGASTAAAFTHCPLPAHRQHGNAGSPISLAQSLLPSPCISICTGQPSTLFFFWTATYYVNKSLYALNFTKKAQISAPKWWTGKTGQTSGLVVLTVQGGFYSLVQLLSALVWQ